MFSCNSKRVAERQSQGRRIQKVIFCYLSIVCRPCVNGTAKPDSISLGSAFCSSWGSPSLSKSCTRLQRQRTNSFVSPALRTRRRMPSGDATLLKNWSTAPCIRRASYTPLLYGEGAATSFGSIASSRTPLRRRNTARCRRGTALWRTYGTALRRSRCGRRGRRRR